MSIAAAIGYVVGIIVFAIFMRRSRKRMLQKHIDEAKHTLTRKDTCND